MIETRTVTVTVTWSAFRDIPESHKDRDPYANATITFDTALTDLELCEQLFAATNLYQGDLWDALEPVLPTNRTHTALSVIDSNGDMVTIADSTGTRTYEVASIGFTRIENN